MACRAVVRKAELADQYYSCLCVVETGLCFIYINKRKSSTHEKRAVH
jgi:hypothetical protein